MADPVIKLPAQFDGQTLSKVAADVVACCKDGFPGKLIFDFAQLDFVRPAGVVFLSNLINWLSENGTKAGFINCDPRRQAVKYLDDSLFFEQHSGSKLSQSSTPRDTTRPLLKIAQKDSHEWLEANFVPWLAARLNITQASLYALKVCISELFNNIQDHTRYDIGSIYVQHFPREHSITISVSDFGLGIPAKVREKIPDIHDGDAIVQAVQDGFTTKSKPANKGAGLDYLLNVVVLQNKGNVTVYSGHSIVEFENANGVVHPTVSDNVGFSPGTTIDIEIRTDTIEELPEEREELQW
jgi:anti-sigma regulatory factor (Ser/Thr protein kinase)/anti-anti-sigma regulatory factor